MTPKELLINAKAVIQDPAHWVQEKLAVDASGLSTACRKPDACRWCAMGAMLNQSDGTGAMRKAERLLTAQAEALLDFKGLTHKDNAITAVNDKLTHADVMTMFDKAIESA